MVSNAQALGVLCGLVLLVGVGSFLFAGGLSGDQPNQSTPTVPPTTTNSTPAPSESGGNVTQTPTPTTTPASTTPGGEVTPTEPNPTQIQVNVSRLHTEIEKAVTTRQEHPQTFIDESMFTDSKKSRQLEQMATNHSRRMAGSKLVAHTINGSTTSMRYKEYMGPSDCKIRAPRQNYILRKTELEAIYSYEITSGNESVLADNIADELFLNRPTRRVLRLEGARHMGVGITVLDRVAYIDISVC